MLDANPNLVQLLLEAKDTETLDATMATLQKRLQVPDLILAHTLALIAIDRDEFGPDERGLAIQTLAGARVPAFEPLVVSTILHLCESSNERVLVASIAAATHLSHEGKGRVLQRVERLSESSTPRVRSAAHAFLGYIRGVQ